jgi:hypothetical protein
LLSHIKATGTVDGWHQTPFRFGMVVRDLKGGMTRREAT